MPRGGHGAEIRVAGLARVSKRRVAVLQQRDKVLVTGATGFVGAAVARALQAEGADLRLLVRPSSPRANLASIKADVVVGDLLEPQSLAAAMSGVGHLYHVAADYRIWAPRVAEIVANNRTGTLNIMRAALDAGVSRIVYTSSVAVLPARADGTPVDESQRLAPGDAIGAYKRSKVEAEMIVTDLAEREGLPAVIVNPSTPIGPGDIRPTPTGRIVVEAASGRIPAFVDTGLNIVHVDDVAAGHLAAMAHGRVGERYILGGEDVRLSEMLATIAEIVGRRPPVTTLPRRMLFPAAYISQAVALLTGREPLLTVDGLRMARYKMFFRSDKAMEHLGYRARPYADALSDAIAWFRTKGYVA